MRKATAIIVMALLSFHFITVSAQTKGRIVDKQGIPFQNQTIYLNGKAIRTDADGAFGGNAKLGDTLLVDQKKYFIDSLPFELTLGQRDDLVRLGEILVKGNRFQIMDQIQFSKEQLGAYKGSSNADLFNGLPGLQVNNIRNEAGALDIGIRGLQGDGRVAVVIDGDLQSTQTFRGYQGSSDRTYVEMELVKQVKVEKGPSTNPNAVGATGGVVEMSTIDAEDVVMEGNRFGVLLKGNLTNNNYKPVIPEDEIDQEYYVLQNGIKEKDFRGGTGMAALAYKGDKIDLLLSGVTRNQGNFFAGTRGASRYGYLAEYYDVREQGFQDHYKKPEVRPGQEVVNTSYQSRSLLGKLGWNIGRTQRLEANYRFHGQEAGEVMAAYWYKQRNDKNFEKWPLGTESMPQWELGTAKYHFYGLDYRFNPNQLVDLKVSLFANQGDLKQRNGIGWTLGAHFGDQYLHQFGNDRTGVTVLNRSKLAALPLTLQYGVNYQVEEMEPHDVPEGKRGSARHGQRKVYSGFVSAHLLLGDFTAQALLKGHQTDIEDRTVNETISYGPKGDLSLKADYAVLNWLNLFAKAASTNRSPSLYEGTRSVQVFSYNPEYPLVPERNILIEFGLQASATRILGDSDTGSFGVNLFRNNTKNYLSTTIAPDYSTAFFLNYDKFQLEGMDISLDYNSQHVFFNASATLFEDPIVQSESIAEMFGVESTNSIGFEWSVLSNRIPPSKSFLVGAGVYAFDKKLSLGGRIRYHSSKKNPDDWFAGTGVGGLAVNIPADHLIDVNASYRFNSHLRSYLNVNNLTDRYQYDLGTIIRMPVPGRTIQLGLEFNI